MRKIFWSIFFTIATSIFLMHGPTTTSIEENKMEIIKVFYVPFDVATFVPVTKDSIEKQADCVFQLPAEHGDVQQLKKLIYSSEKGDFNNSLVRIKIVGLHSSPFFVDMLGGILNEEHNKNRKLSDNKLSKLKSLMLKLEKERPKECHFLWHEKS